MSCPSHHYIAHSHTHAHAHTLAHRSGKEGLFPKLEEFAEKRLSELDPASGLLVAREPGRKRVGDLPREEQLELEREMEVCVY